MPNATQGLRTARTTLCKWWIETLPACFIPCESMESPAAAKTVTPARTRYLRKVKVSNVSKFQGFKDVRPRFHLETLKPCHFETCFSRIDRFSRRRFRVLLHQFVARRA